VHELHANEGALYVGAWPGSMGFVISVDDAARVLRRRSNAEVVRPFYTGADLAEMPILKPRRYVIDFSLVPQSDAESRFPELFAAVEQHVKEERMLSKKKVYRDRWWQFCEPQATVFTAIRKHETTLAVARVSKYFTFRFVPTQPVYSDKVVVYDRRSFADFAILNSEIHNQWALLFGATHGAGTPNYKPSTCGRTFPFPAVDEGNSKHLCTVGAALDLHLSTVFNGLNLGPTDTYNRFHDRGEQSEVIARLRKLHSEMDRAVAAAYGWSNLDLDHDFHKTKQGIRYTISETARHQVLDRLQALNHQRHAEEEAERLAQRNPVQAKRSRNKKDEKRDFSGQPAMELL